MHLGVEWREDGCDDTSRAEARIQVSRGGEEEGGGEVASGVGHSFVEEEVGQPVEHKSHLHAQPWLERLVKLQRGERRRGLRGGEEYDTWKFLMQCMQQVWNLM